VTAALSIAFGLTAPRGAVAATYYTRFCFNWTVDFSDASGSSYDDYYTSNGAQIARGVYWEIRESVDNSIVATGYADESGTYAGCTNSTVALYSTVDYDVIIYSKTFVNGNYVKVFDESGSPNHLANALWTDWSPAASGTQTADSSTVGDWVNVIAAASLTIFRHNGGVTGETYTVYASGEDAGTSGCQSHPTAGSSLNCGGAAYVAPGHHDNKYVISHEVGHNMARLVNGGSGATAPYGATQTTECSWSDVDSHAMVSLEYQGAAANEGMAHFIAATTFNDTAESDCWFAYYKSVDWDHDGDNDGAPLWTDCEYSEHCDGSGESCGAAGAIAVADHFGNECNSIWVTNNRGVEYDWLRFWWDLRTNEDVAFYDCMTIWDVANPNSWNGAATGSDGSTCPSTGWPASRLRCAASSAGYLTEWDGLDNYNGVHR
jgi:hypothetical protein